VPNRPVVISDSNSLLEPPESNAASSANVNGAPSCSNTKTFEVRRSRTDTDEAPGRGPASSAFCSSSNGQRAPATCGLLRASFTRERIRRASFRVCCFLSASAYIAKASLLIYNLPSRHWELTIPLLPSTSAQQNARKLE
jgi:hypothetical protein